MVVLEVLIQVVEVVDLLIILLEQVLVDLA